MRRARTGLSLVALLAMLAACASAPEAIDDEPAPASTPDAGERRLRVAVFNTALNRPEAGALARELRAGSEVALQLALVIRTVRPDVIVLQEIDFDPEAEAIEQFQLRYLYQRHGTIPGAEYLRYMMTGPVNTGVRTGFDLDRDGTKNGPGDAHGYGAFPGQYGMAVLSRFPIETTRSFRKLRWVDMPGARLPDDPATAAPGDWYAQEALAVLRLSSKSHWMVELDVEGRPLHLLVAHPTPPTFDGPEDRNGRRNADEIRLLVEMIDGEASWLVDDSGVVGGVPAGEPFVVLGDLNADPVDGDDRGAAIRQLLDHPRVQDPRPRSEGAVQAARAQGGANARHDGDPALDTGDFDDVRGPGNLRVDYVLPSTELRIVDSGVFWPEPDDPRARLGAASDHHLVWVDVVLPARDAAAAAR